MATQETTIQGWHFTTETLRDGRPIPAVGEVLTHEGEVEPCSSGLHASRRLIDAIGYAPYESTKVHRVELYGDIQEQSDKLAARHRTILYTVEAEGFLREFAREVALEAFLTYYPEPEGEDEDYGLVLAYLATGDAGIRAEAQTAGWRLRDAAWSRYYAADAAAARAAA
ncbi:MAG: hypothetical protein ABIW84_00465, partial [Ilumatobacteraceae bacterium]